MATAFSSAQLQCQKESSKGSFSCVFNLGHWFGKNTSFCAASNDNLRYIQKSLAHGYRYIEL